jgi:predicted dehydrogenase
MDIAKTRIAVTGVGAIGGEHARILQHSPTCELSAIVDPVPGAVAIAEQAGVPLYKSLNELFEKHLPDGVILATPNQLHLEHTLSCIQAGVPILLEKPIASTVQDGERIVEEVDKAGATLLIGHHRAHSPIMACAKRLIDEGRLGRIVAVMGSSDQHDPRDSQPAHAVWGDRRGTGVFIVRHAKVSGRRYRRDQPALCERRSRYLHVI